MAEFNLIRISKLIKSELLLIILGVLSITIFSIAVISFTKRGKAPPPAQTPWNENIYAGQTTKQELETKLGTPEKIEAIDEGVAYFYPTEDRYRPDKIEISGDTVSIIKEQVLESEKGGLNNYLQKYGTPQAKLYGPFGTIAPGHFWGNNGIIVFGNEHDGTIVEIWYFAPTNLENFLAQNTKLKTEEPRGF
ncbi:hypothetical protein A2870_04080 [Candidatus Curtissbacteria bacterium RIFCSPHIGHO2_01_FULL_41_11]|uniref:Uncharacterized protein n=1 Tax=Candidatus Curtissbacteria bacterium RIFCSPHIGHO2_01_FULL_41_11 TaxID=1797711 RepID=A0A1F5G6N5_9BACT|nr:MAG: hypothetical protein A2870_04080 [Candidatus Curtissbacteria bacterium RIFCSPHIGHO2_01_FULL_41_11]